MARMVSGPGQGSRVWHGFTNYVKAHEEAIRVGVVAMAVAFFFTHGLPLWNDDYSQWLAQANAGIWSLLKRLILPFTSEPQAWGYSDRPAQVLIYWVLQHVFGTWGTGYFFVKSAVFGGLVGVLYHWMRYLGVDRLVAYLCVAVFVLSTNVLAAVIWHSDFGIYSQLVLALILLWAHSAIEKNAGKSSTHKRVWLGLFFAAVYFGTKLKGDVRLAPVILLIYLLLFRRERFREYLAPFSLTFLATLPWSTQMFRALPPFLGGSGYSGWTFGKFSFVRVWQFLGGDAFSISAAPLSLLGGAGILLALAVFAYAIYRIYRGKFSVPDAKWGFFLVWLGVALACCGVLSEQNSVFQLRYTLIPMVPAILLLAMVAQSAFRELRAVPYFKQAVIALFAMQCGLHLYHDFQHRRDMGHTMVAVDKVFRTMEQTHPDGQLLMLSGFLPYGYDVKSAASAIVNRKTISDLNGLGQFQAGKTWVARWGSVLDGRLSVELAATGCAASLFDVMFPCGPAEGAVLMRYLGQSIPELGEAEQLEKSGNGIAARQVLETYLQKEPGNHGAAWQLGLLYYRQGEFDKMDQLYERRLAPFFPNHVSVLYNWGLAKQGVKQFAAASQLFERARALAPKDYAIGYNLADSYYRQDKKSRALATIDELLKLYPDNESLKRSREAWKIGANPNAKL